MTVEFATALAKMEVTSLLKDIKARNVTVTQINLGGDDSAAIRMEKATQRVVDKLKVRFNNTYWDNKRIAFTVKYQEKERTAWIMVTRVTK